MLILSLIYADDKRVKIELIYNKYHKLMFYIANQILLDSILAEYAVQDAFIKIIENVDKIEDVSSHKTKGYIVTIVRNHSINLYNELKRKSSIPLENIEYMLFEELVPNDKLEESDILGSVLGKLHVIYRDVITLKFVDEFTNKEIAQALDINEATVRKRLERAKGKLKILLQKRNLNTI